ncbi:MAG: TonB-dependent receptor [Alloprevotella sp.]|nr:TonB-dependent receptor [Alloprevotella sp.]
MYRHFTLFILNIFCALAALAQGSVSGRIIETENRTPLEFVSVSVRQSGQSRALKSGYTDTEGEFLLSGLPQGKYTVRFTLLGYGVEQHDFTIAPGRTKAELGDIALKSSDVSLGAATVTGQRSEMKLEVDRKTFNVESQISLAGQSAAEVLENIPSVEVDNDGNVSLRGNTGVEVWINGRQAGLTSDNQGDILQQLPAESIERIEVIDNPSAKFSAEGSAGIINIVLKKDLKPGYYGSVQLGGDTHGGANTSGNINYNSGLFDAYLNIGLRHRAGKGGSESQQEYYATDMFQRYAATNRNRGNNLFSRAGVTLHATKRDDIGLSGMFMLGGRNSSNLTPYHYGRLSTGEETSTMYRRTKDSGDMRMMNLELTYRHTFSEKHFLDISASHNQFHNDGDNWYRDSTVVYDPLGNAATDSYSYQYRPMRMDNRRWEAKVDYENQISEQLKLQTCYQANLFHENSPQESWVDNASWDGANAQEERDFFNRFIYDNQIHALYATLSYNVGPFGIMGGLRGEYWRVETESLNWEQEHGAAARDAKFEKDYFQLFPSLFMSYQLTPRDQLQLNYTRRLRRPWGGQLNSFKDTRDATMVRFGNPELTPEYSNSFSLNYLRTWEQHSLLVSAYYRPTTDVMQRINWQSTADGIMYQSNFNVARSTSTGLELTAKNKLARILDISTNANFYYYKLNGYTFNIDGQDIHGDGRHSFSWNLRMQSSLMLPWDLSFQATGRFRGREAIAQGHRNASGSLDLGLRKNLWNKLFTLSLNVRDLLNTRRMENYTSSDTFWRHQKNWRNSRAFSLTLTYNFGNAKPKKPQRRDGDDEDMDTTGGYGDTEM